jgi:MerR family transcriptional regulator/heat shock protein HspR
MTNIPHNEPVFQISVVSRMVGLHQQTIRSYERVGLVRPARSSGNTRLYSAADIERLQQVVRLVNDLGVNLAGVDVILRMSRQIEELQDALSDALEELERRRGEERRGEERRSERPEAPGDAPDVPPGPATT